VTAEWSSNCRSDTLKEMDRFHWSRTGCWWVVAVCFVGACGGRSGELYDDAYNPPTGGAGVGGDGGNSTGGSGGSATGGSGGFATGGSGGNDTGGSGGIGGNDTGGSGGFAIGGSGGIGGFDTGGNTSIGGNDTGGSGGNDTGGSGGIGGNDTGGSGGFATGGSGGTNTSSTTGLIGGIGGFGGTTTVTTTGGPLDCLGCIGQECPFIAQCVQDKVCYDRLVCTVEVCLQGGDLSLACIIKCHEGDYAAAVELGLALNCAADSCGDRCEFQ